jgi:CheY-like chemotaxis protein
MPVPISILIYGRDARLLETRKMVLESAGYRVYLASDLSTADQILPEKQVDLLILCHSLSMEDCGRALALTYHWPMMRSLVLTAGDDGCRENLLSEVILTIDGPPKLVLTVGRLLHVESQTLAHVH